MEIWGGWEGGNRREEKESAVSPQETFKNATSSGVVIVDKASLHNSHTYCRDPAWNWGKEQEPQQNTSDCKPGFIARTDRGMKHRGGGPNPSTLSNVFFF